IIYGSRNPDDPEVAALLRETGNGAAAVPPADAAARAPLVLLAVPATAGEEVVASLGDLSGKILIEPMNSLTIENGYAVAASDPRRSIAEQVQTWAPDAIVIKAFNTLNYSVMEDPALAGGP